MPAWVKLNESEVVGRKDLKSELVLINIEEECKAAKRAASLRS
jgi:hypothetical protein